MKFFIVLILFFSFTGCSEEVKGESLPSGGIMKGDDNIKNEKQSLEKIAALMQTQELAWNAGDLTKYMQAYSKSDSLVFIGSRGLNYGWETTLNNYQQSYPNKEKMGMLTFENKILEVLNPNAAWAAGRWNLFRTMDTLSGSYLLIWKKINGKWKIIADHSS